jgi:5'-3' exonuclease
MTERPDTLLLLDTASLYFRAFFGIPDSVRSPDGLPVNAVRGLLDMTARLIVSRRPGRLVACWDDDWRPAWRVALVPTYKQHRLADPAGVNTANANAETVPDELAMQVPVIREALLSLGIPVIGAIGCEADDVIGTLATRSSIPVDIVTGDRDLFQLVDDARNVRVLYTVKGGVGNAAVMDEAAVFAKYGVPASHYADFATMRGDSSDGLPGVAGIGDKTAASLVATYGDLASIRAAAADPKTGLSPTIRRKLLDASDYLDNAVTVVAVLRDAELELPATGLGVPSAPADPDMWAALDKQFDLGSSARRLEAVLAGR